MLELKDLLSQVYANKAIAQANEIWTERKLSDVDMEKWLNKNL
jgi:hypothetical protein